TACAATSLSNTDSATAVLADCISTEFTFALLAALDDADADGDSDRLIDGVIVECKILYTALEASLIADGQPPAVAATVVADSRTTARAEMVRFFTETPE
ncbi:MAG: hypothetical protein HOH89_03310, partial [Alphaproteobacteria bacterium]|nr:hypothetical protein [Alphaproteobacteria bacterium]